MVQIWSVIKDITAKRTIEMVREEERKLLLEHEEDTKALNRNNGALYTHKADGRPGQAKKWCTKCKKVSHDTANCWADETCEYCHKKGHIKKACRLKKELEEARECRNKDTKDQKAKDKEVFGF